MKKIIVIIAVVIMMVLIVGLVYFELNQYKNKVDLRLDAGNEPLRSYNAKYNTYFGNNKSYAETKALISQVKNHNNNQDEVGRWGIISILKENSVNMESQKVPIDYNTENVLYEVNEKNLKQAKQYTIGLKGINTFDAICEIGIYEQNAYMID